VGCVTDRDVGAADPEENEMCDVTTQEFRCVSFAKI
jgi:hypothetical protein